MSKPTITRLFVGAIVAVAAGLVLVLAAAVASDLALTVTLAVVGSLTMLAGAVAGVVSWVGALLNTAHLEDKNGLRAARVARVPSKLLSSQR